MSRYRLQRLYLKVELCIKVVNDLLKDRSLTVISEWLSEEDLQAFKRAVRLIVKADIDATMDSWPKRLVHDYTPDARKTILTAIEGEWNLFVVDGYEDFVPSEIVHDAFYKA